MNTEKSRNLTDYIQSKAAKIVQHYSDDLEYDLEKIKTMFSENKENRYFYVMLRKCGSWAFPVREVFVENSFPYCVWLHYADQHIKASKEVKCFLIEVEKVWGGNIHGKVRKVNYPESVKDVVGNAVHSDPELETEFGPVGSLEEIQAFRKLISARCVF